MKDVQSRIKTENGKHFETPQPYIAICGKDLDKIECIHVIIDECILNFQSAVDAVDFLFKFMYVTQMKYPHTCGNVWSFLQNFVYSIEDVKRSSPSTAVRLFKVALNNLTKQFDENTKTLNQSMTQEVPPENAINIVIAEDSHIHEIEMEILQQYEKQ